MQPHKEIIYMCIVIGQTFLYCLLVGLSWKKFLFCSWTHISILFATYNSIDLTQLHPHNILCITVCSVAGAFIYGQIELVLKQNWIILDSNRRSYNAAMGYCDSSSVLAIIFSKVGKIVFSNKTAIENLKLESLQTNNIYSVLPQLETIKGSLESEFLDKIPDTLEANGQFFKVLCIDETVFKGLKSIKLELLNITKDRVLQKHTNRDLNQIVSHFHKFEEQSSAKVMHNLEAEAILLKATQKDLALQMEAHLMITSRCFSEDGSLKQNCQEGRLKNYNFLLKETFCNVIDVISHRKSTSEEELVLQTGVIPNEVNGCYYKFQVMLFSLLETLCQNDERIVNAESQRNESTIILNFLKAIDDSKLLFKVEVQHPSIAVDRSKYIGINDSTDFKNALISKEDEENVRFMNALILLKDFQGDIELNSLYGFTFTFVLASQDLTKKSLQNESFENMLHTLNKRRNVLSLHETRWQSLMSMSIASMPTFFSFNNEQASSPKLNNKPSNTPYIDPFYKYTRRTDTLMFQDALWRMDKQALEGQNEEEGQDEVSFKPVVWSKKEGPETFSPAVKNDSLYNHQRIQEIQISQMSNPVLVPPTEEQSQLRVLLVEDNRFGRSFMKVMLNEVGIFQIGIAKTGVDAVKEYKYAVEHDQPFDVILMDLILPEMDGYEATTKIREYEEEIKISKPTFVCGNTAYISKSIQQNILPFGFNQVLMKPINIKHLKEIIRILKWKKQEGLKTTT